MLEGLKDVNMRHSKNFVKTFADLTMKLTPQFMYSAEDEVVDGFWIRSAPEANIMAYFFPADKLFEALEIFRNFTHDLLSERDSLITKTDFKFNQPCEFRYVTLTKDSAVLQYPNVEGEYVVIEALHI